jgi:hypothetical protein
MTKNFFFLVLLAEYMQIRARRDELEKMAQQIMSRPKPAPPKQPEAKPAPQQESQTRPESQSKQDSAPKKQDSAADETAGSFVFLSLR